jgi:hypothetical protein
MQRAAFEHHKISRRNLLAAALIGCGLLGSSMVAAPSGNTEMLEEDGTAAVTRAEEIASSKGPVELGDSAVRVPLFPSPGVGAEKDWLEKKLKTLPPTSRIRLVLRDLSAAKQPGVLFRLYFDLPPETTLSGRDVHYIGAVNFFNASKVAAPEYGNRKGRRFYSYDVSPTLRKLSAGGRLSDRPTITIIPAGVPVADAKATIGRIELVQD